MRFLIIVLFIAASTMQSAFALSANQDLRAWRLASGAERAQLCVLMARRMRPNANVRAADLCACMTTTAGDGGLDSLKISEIAALCAVLITQGG